MNMLVIILVLAAVAAVAVFVVLNPKLAQRKETAIQATTDAAAGNEILLRDDGASCLGIERGGDKPRHFGEGSAALTATTLIFTPTLSGETTVVQRTAIREVVVDSAHIIKSAQTAALKIVWDEGEAGDATGRWKVDPLDKWVSALGGTTEPAPDTEE